MVANIKIDVSACGFLKHKGGSEIGENEKEILKGEEYYAVGYEWAINVLRGSMF